VQSREQLQVQKEIILMRLIKPIYVALALGAIPVAGCVAPQASVSDEQQLSMSGPEVVELWGGLPPGAKPLPAAESQVVNTKGWRPITEIHNVSTPSFTVFRPAKGQANGSAMVVLPGGAFGILAWDVEGTEVAEFLAKRGITAFVLKYRVNDPTPEDLRAFMALMSDPTKPPDAATLGKILRIKAEVAVEDAMQAMRLLRTNPARYGINPNRIGMMGFSAGAITTLAVLQRADDGTRPNIAAPIYGLAIDTEVPAKTPPLFMAVAKDDPVMASASTDIQNAWQAAGKASELHILESGEHGFGLGRADTDSTRFPDLLETWLRAQGFIGSRS
jgi:acetyl esterase/lipase